MWWLPLFTLLPIAAFALAIRWFLHWDRQGRERLRASRTGGGIILPYAIGPSLAAGSHGKFAAPKAAQGPGNSYVAACQGAAFTLTLLSGEGERSRPAPEPQRRAVATTALSSTSNPSDSYRTLRFYVHSQTV
jgi:hypothetical protein